MNPSLPVKLAARLYTALFVYIFHCGKYGGKLFAGNPPILNEVNSGHIEGVKILTERLIYAEVD